MKIAQTVRNLEIANPINSLDRYPDVLYLLAYGKINGVIVERSPELNNTQESYAHGRWPAYLSKKVSVL